MIKRKFLGIPTDDPAQTTRNIAKPQRKALNQRFT
jgi:hypothetical protein